MLAAPAASILGLPKLSPSANETLKQDGQALVELRRTINAPCENVHVANYGQHLESRHLRAMRISRRVRSMGAARHSQLHDCLLRVRFQTMCDLRCHRC
jgi:hypothetical protein